MNRLLLAMVLLLLPSATPAHMSPAPAVPAKPEPRVTVEKVGEDAWCLFGQGGNLGVVVTPGAVLVVDTQYEPIAPELLAEIRKLSDAPIRFIINTHFHEDHTGGNGVFAADASTASIVGHQQVRRRLYEGQAGWAESFPGRIERMDGILGSGREMAHGYRTILEKAVAFLKRRLTAARAFDPSTVVAPSITYDRTLRLFPGGEEVVLFHEGPGHTDGDSMVWIPGRKVLHMGDLFWNGHYPFIDIDGGGATSGWLKNLDSALERIPDDAQVIAGHGKVGGKRELARFRDYLADLRGAVSQAMSEGRSLEEAVEGIRLEGYDDIQASFMSLPANIVSVWQELGGDPGSPKM